MPKQIVPQIPNSLKSLLRDVLSEAKTAMQIDDRLQPVAIPLAVDEILDPIPLRFEKGTNELETFCNVGAFCRMHDAIGVVIVFTGAGKKFRTKSEEEYFSKNFETENPLTYPENMRDNYILVQYVDFNNFSCNVVKFCQFFRDSENIRFSRSMTKETGENPVSSAVQFAWKKIDRKLTEVIQTIDDVKKEFNLDTCENCPDYEICKKACIDNFVEEISIGKIKKSDEK